MSTTSRYDFVKAVTALNERFADVNAWNGDVFEASIHNGELRIRDHKHVIISVDRAGTIDGDYWPSLRAVFMAVFDVLDKDMR